VGPVVLLYVMRDSSVMGVCVALLREDTLSDDARGVGEVRG
jgi:hypothetical protein